MSSSFSEEQIKKAIDEIFKEFDADHNSKLDAAEVTTFFNKVLSFLGVGRTATNSEIQAFMNAADANHDGKITKAEVQQLFKKIDKAQ